MILVVELLLFVATISLDPLRAIGLESNRLSYTRAACAARDSAGHKFPFDLEQWREGDWTQ